MKNKIIVLVLLGVTVLCGTAFFFRDDISDMYTNWDTHQTNMKNDEILRTYTSEMISIIKHGSWKTYSDNYVSFRYPESWTVVDLTQEQLYKGRYYSVLRINSPAMTDASGFIKYPYNVLFRISSPENYVLRRTDASALIQAIKKQDISSIVNCTDGGPQHYLVIM